MIGVTSKSFSENIILREKLSSLFPNVRFNDSGQSLNPHQLKGFLNDCTGAITALDIIDDELLSHCSKLKVISKFGVGLDSIDFNACEKHKVSVLSTPGANKESVAELVLGLMISLSRNIQIGSNLLSQGIWKKNAGRQLSELTIGIIGVGHIGKTLIEVLSPFHPKIIVHDIIHQDEYYKGKNIKEVSKSELLKESDIITLHVPLNNETQNMISKEELQLMKKSSYLINTSRGGVVNESELKLALKSKLIAGAALDVFEVEPPVDFELLKLDNLICTPHIAGTSQQAILNLGLSAIDQLKSYFSNHS